MALEWIESKGEKKRIWGQLGVNFTSLVAQWLRIRLPTQGIRVWALVQEDPTCRGATKAVDGCRCSCCCMRARSLSPTSPSCLSSSCRLRPVSFTLSTWEMLRAWTELVVLVTDKTFRREESKMFPRSWFGAGAAWYVRWHSFRRNRIWLLELDLHYVENFIRQNCTV